MRPPDKQSFTNHNQLNPVVEQHFSTHICLPWLESSTSTLSPHLIEHPNTSKMPLERDWFFDEHHNTVEPNDSNNPLPPVPDRNPRRLRPFPERPRPVYPTPTPRPTYASSPQIREQPICPSLPQAGEHSRYTISLGYSNHSSSKLSGGEKPNESQVVNYSFPFSCQIHNIRHTRR